MSDVVETQSVLVNRCTLLSDHLNGKVAAHVTLCNMARDVGCVIQLCKSMFKRCNSSLIRTQSM